MYRFLAQLKPEHVEAIAAFVQMEMAEAGYGASVEFHYLHHAPGGAPYADVAEMSGRIAAAAAQSGLGLTLLPVLYQQGGCDGRPLGPGQDRFGADLTLYDRILDGAETALSALPGDARAGVAAHSLRAVTPEALAEAARLRPDAPFHMHIAEQTAEIDEVRAAWGARPVEWLLDAAEVGPRWCLIHCTHMTDAETGALAATGAVAGLCPITESNLGDGVFNALGWRAAGGSFGVGSDSNIRIALAEELRTLEYSQRLAHRGRAMLAETGRSAGRVLFDAAAQGGAQAAGRASGAIAPGLLADLTALDGAAVDLVGRRGDPVLDSWIFAGDDRMVASVWSAGRRIVSGGRHIRRDAIDAAYRKAMATLSQDL